MPSERQETGLAALAELLDEEPSALRDEFTELAVAESPASSLWHVERWPKPVATGALLDEIVGKIRKFIAARPHELLTIALWSMMAWIHRVVAVHSPYLVATSADPDSGKSQTLGVLSFLVLKPFIAVEPSGPSLYRLIDREKPTLLLDDADSLFQRKSDIKHIFNAAWTRGVKVSRVVQGVTVWFDPFCPKAISLLGALPRTLAGRSIIIKLQTRMAAEKVEDFTYSDDDEFANLRRKLARWSADNAAAIGERKPRLPGNFSNRLAMNWRLLLATAELAGGAWPAQARTGAERLSRAADQPSLGKQLLAAFQAIFAAGRKEVLSKTVITELNGDPTGPWIEYRRGPITERQVALLLDQYEIQPRNIGNARLKGYHAKDFENAFARFLPQHPLIRSKKRR